MKRYDIERLQKIYRESITAFAKRNRLSDLYFTKKIDSFCRSCVIFLLISEEIEISEGMEVIEGLYTDYRVEKSVLEKQYNYILNHDIDVKAEFFIDIINEDICNSTNNSRVFVEGLKLLFINCVLINGDVSEKAAKIITRITDMLSYECDRNCVKNLSFVVNVKDYLICGDPFLYEIQEAEKRMIMVNENFTKQQTIQTNDDIGVDKKDSVVLEKKKHTSAQTAIVDKSVEINSQNGYVFKSVNIIVHSFEEICHVFLNYADKIQPEEVDVGFCENIRTNLGLNAVGQACLEYINEYRDYSTCIIHRMNQWRRKAA